MQPIPAAWCGWITLAANPSAWWQALQFSSTDFLSEWQAVHEFALGCRAIAGNVCRLWRAWGSETGAGANAFAYRKAVPAEAAATITIAQVKNDPGHFRLK